MLKYYFVMPNLPLKYIVWPLHKIRLIVSIRPQNKSMQLRVKINM